VTSHSGKVKRGSAELVSTENEFPVLTDNLFHLLQVALLRGLVNVVDVGLVEKKIIICCNFIT
jgi:hypothetical protein